MQFLSDNVLLVAVMLLSALALALPYLTSKRYGPSVNPQEATYLINKKNAQIVDVRKAADFRKGHLPNAVNMPHDQLQNLFKQLDRKRPVILVDQSGATSRRCALQLRNVGFQEVFVLDGGLVDWVKGNLPLE